MNASDASAASARNDLAFMRAVAEDRGPLPRLLGAHLFAVGALYGANTIWGWAGLSGYLPWPGTEAKWLYLPASIAYLPLCIWLNVRAARIPWGPGARAFAAAWSAVAMMTFGVVGVVTLGAVRTGVGYQDIWPALAFALYCGAWTMTGIALRKAWAVFVALGCLGSGLACAWLLGLNEQWLAMGIGLLLFMALPGAAMMRRTPSAKAA